MTPPMTLPSDDVISSQPPRPRRRRRGGWTLRLTPGGFLLLMIFDLIFLALLAWPVLRAQVGMFVPSILPYTSGTLPVATPATAVPSLSPSPSATLSPTATPSSTPPPVSAATAANTLAPLAPVTLPNGLLILSLADGANAHLFAYAPDTLPLTRLTSGAFDDIAPALSPDGRSLAFASNRNGYWDLYLLEIASGEITRLTDTPEYDGAPSWSPDGLWLVYESYTNDNLEIFIRPLSGEQPPIQLTTDDATDHSPAWSPGGRQIAFVSTRSGESEIWLADLDTPGDERFRNLSRNPRARESRPVWAPGAASLAWAAVEDGLHRLWVWDSAQPDARPREAGSGDWPAWSADGKTLLTALLTPAQTYLTAYPQDQPGLALPPLVLPGNVSGLVWADIPFPRPLPETYRDAVMYTPAAPWQPALTPPTDLPADRQRVVDLASDVQAPYPMLHDAVDEAFSALRQQIATESGWDFLYSLENAFVPITSPLGPGMGEDWLYTGRAFAFNTQPLYAGWIAIVREDFGDTTYWRVYLRTQFQDGSAGIPLHELPWDFNARYNGNTNVYEQGGALAADTPPGYWLDLTRLAALYGWERLPALPLWRAAYPLARFNEFAQTSGLEWRTAMLEIYPPEALITPSPVIPATRTPTRTPRGYQTPTPSPSATPRPTLTPISPTPTETLTPTASLTLTPTPQPTNTPTATPSPRPTRTSAEP